MAFHCHQPVDNFGFVFDEAFQKSYKPFLEILERHPDIKVSLHYSGPLFDWFRKHKPSFLDKINKLLERKQVELLSGGYFEPVLPIIPERDRVGQIKMMTDFIKRTFNYTPRGAWLTERVWDPELAGLFKGLDVKYTILDSFHLKQAGKKEALPAPKEGKGAADEADTKKEKPADAVPGALSGAGQAPGPSEPDSRKKDGPSKSSSG